MNLTDPDNITPLLMATLNARFDTAVYLIDAGADVNRWDTWGRAPLYSAIDFNTPLKGGRPDRPSSDATTALQVAEKLLLEGRQPQHAVEALSALSLTGSGPGRRLDADRRHRRR